MQSSYTFAVAAQATVDAYADVKLTTGLEGDAAETVFVAMTSGPISIDWKNTDGSNGITVQVLAANFKWTADADWNVVSGPTAILAGAKAFIELDLARYMFYRLQHKSTSAGNPGTSVAYGRQARI